MKMQSLSPESASPFAVTPDLGFLGFWQCDFRTQTVRASPEVNRLFGICVEQIDDAVPLALYGLRIHPEDLEWLDEGRKSSVGPSGHGVVEYRVIDAAGETHWLMCRGLYETDVFGNLISGHGMLMDITAFKADGNSMRSAIQDNLKPIERFADLLLEAFAVAKDVGSPALLAQVRSILLLTGKILAWQTEQDVFARRH